jgi:uncharacterized protein (DUF885 family)
MSPWKIPAAALALLLFTSTPMFAQPSEDEKLQAFFKDYLEKSFRHSPVAATALGDHRFDGKLDDISPSARAEWRAFLEQTLDELPRRIAFAELSPDGKVDFEIWRDDLAAQLWSLDNIRPFETDARTYGRYLSDSVYTLLAQSTAPKETNIANAIARMEEMPRIVAEAKRSLTKPIKPILLTAILQNRGAIAFYETEIFAFAGDTPQKEKLAAAAARVATALKDHQKFLEDAAMERADDHWRLGAAKFGAKFAREMGAAVTAEQNLADAEAEFARVQDELHTIARQLWPRYFPDKTLPPDDAAGRRETITKVVAAVSREHGKEEELISRAQATVQGIKDFIRRKNFLPLPEPDQCAVIAMPEFRRGNSLAYLESAPPLDPKAASFYAVSPPPADWTPEQKRSFLQEYNDHMLEILTIHEAYPGHYVQLAYANRNPSLIRRVLGSGAYIEGWAVYTEVTMLDEGYGDGDLRLRLMQLKFYLRAVANSILDYRMHCTQTSDAEAMKFLVEDAFQSEGEAKLKIIRAKQSSVQLSTYFVGRMAHYRLRQELQRELGDRFDLARYHEAVLEIGSVPPKFMPELVKRRLGISR